jgi:hypothetical protein
MLGAKQTQDSKAREQILSLNLGANHSVSHPKAVGMLSRERPPRAEIFLLSSGLEMQLTPVPQREILQGWPDRLPSTDPSF